MAIVKTNTTRQYRDLDLNFTIHPVKKDINKNIDEMAVINSVKNLVLTNHYEKPFHPEIGSNVRKLLFENMDKITAATLKREIEDVIRNFEPRVNLQLVNIVPDYDNNGFSVGMEFTIINMTNPITIQFFLQRER